MALYFFIEAFWFSAALRALSQSIDYSDKFFASHPAKLISWLEYQESKPPFSLLLRYAQFRI